MVCSDPTNGSLVPPARLLQPGGLTRPCVPDGTELTTVLSGVAASFFSVCGSNRLVYMKLPFALLAAILAPAPLLAAARPVRTGHEIGLENDVARLAFDSRTGQLLSLRNSRTNDEYLKDLRGNGGPFTLYSRFHSEFLIASQGTPFRAHSDPAAIAGAVTAPPAMRVVSASHRRTTNGLALHLTCRDAGNLWEAELEVWLPDSDGASEWDLRITNRQPQPETLLTAFPDINGLRLGMGEANMHTTLREGGGIMPAWTKAGGIHGDGNQMTMQWHALFDKTTGAHFGLITADPEIRNKWFRIEKPRISVIYFPPDTLRPGASWQAPRTKILIGTGGWKPVARAYRDWFAGAFRLAVRPEWADRVDSYIGAWFAKKGGVLPPGGCAGITQCLDSFAQLPAAYLKFPADMHEYAFHSRGSARDSQVHTDGDNVLREDLGGAPALEQGIAGVHQLGYRFAFYVEGYIVHQSSELARSGKALRWSVMHRDGGAQGNYTKHGFYHMCPGSVEWQDHLAESVSRLIRETGADCVRLDSLGFYFLPCYNPAHHHESPFGYGRWIRELLDKVSRAARAANPDCLLTTEAPVDFYSPWFHGALHLNTNLGRELPLMRLALPGYRPYLYAAVGPVYGSLSGLPGGSNGYGGGPALQTLDENWRSVRHGVAQTLLYGEVGDADPEASLPDVTCRLFHGAGYSVVVCARVEGMGAIEFPKEIRLSRDRRLFTVRVKGLHRPLAGAYLFDIETTQAASAPLRRDGGDILLESGGSNWFMAVLREDNGPALATLDPLPPLRAGESRTVNMRVLTPHHGKLRAVLSARGLDVAPGTFTVTVRAGAVPGRYQIALDGPGLIGMKRFVDVLP